MKLKRRGDLFMKKLLLLSLILCSFVSFSEEGSLGIYYGRNISGNGSMKNHKINKVEKGGSEFALEGEGPIPTDKDDSPFRIGMGLAFRNVKFQSNDIKDLDKLKTMPIYLLAKYDFNSKNKNSVRPYVKAKLGYSFNDGESSYFVKPDYQTNNRYEIKYSNGVYSGIGAGVQYGPFVLDLSYNINSFKTREKIEYNWGTRNNTLESKNHKTTIKAVTLSAGVVLDLSGF